MVAPILRRRRAPTSADLTDLAPESTSADLTPKVTGEVTGRQYVLGYPYPPVAGAWDGAGAW